MLTWRGNRVAEAFTIRGEFIRVISARDMSESEMRCFEHT